MMKSSHDNTFGESTYLLKPDPMDQAFPPFVDLSRVKAETTDDTYNSFSTETMDSQYMDIKPDVKKPAKRGRKPQLQAYGKSGEKLEKRREQNRRAAAVYRHKMTKKKKSIEEEHSILENSNRLLVEENEKLRREMESLQAILKDHQHQCKLNLSEVNNNSLTISAETCVNLAPSLGFPTEQFVQEINAFIPNEHRQCYNTTDQSLVESPFTPKNSEIFTFDLVCNQKDDMAPPQQYNALSPAVGQFSCSPAPPTYPSGPGPQACTQSQYAPFNASVIPFSEVFSSAQTTLEPDNTLELLNEYIRENMAP